MLGVSYNSTVVVTLLIDRSKYHPCTIERKSNKREIKKDGKIVKTIEAYDPAEVFGAFIKENSGGREKVVLVNGYETLSYLESNPEIRYIIFDAAQVLSKNEIEIIDAELPIGNNGVWKTYKNFPKLLKNKLPSMEKGFTYIKVTPDFKISTILEEVAVQLSKPEAFKRLVAKYICGIISKETWNKKAFRLSSFLNPKSYNRLLSWVHSFGPDALSLVYMDILFNAPDRCEKYVEEFDKGKLTKETQKKFMSILEKSCKDCNADIEDMLYLLSILPPNINNRDKFLFPMPPHLSSYRKSYPLVYSNTKKILPNI